jgi:hypothetical protein
MNIGGNKSAPPILMVETYAQKQNKKCHYLKYSRVGAAPVAAPIMGLM